MINEILEFDWGVVTPDLYNKVKNVVVHAFCFELRSIEKRNRAIKFIVGKVYWFNKHLPKNVLHDIVIDIRGQNLNSLTIKEIEIQVKKELDLLDNNLKFNITFKQ